MRVLGGTGSALVSVVEGEYLLKESGEVVRLADHQKRILEHCFTPDADGVMPYRTVVYSTPKKEGKTEVGAMVGYGWARTQGGLILSIANDKVQATERMFNRLKEALGRIERADADFWKRVVGGRGTDDWMGFKEMPSEVKAIPCDPYGESGGHYSLTYWDEIWGFRDSDLTNRLWSELQPVPTVKNSMRFVTTYAGWLGESELLWNIYEEVVKPDPEDPDTATGEKVPGLEDLPCYRLGSTFVYWDHENRMPWKTEKFLNDARTDPVMRAHPKEYQRLWQNKWTTSEESFIDIGQVDKLMSMGSKAGLINHFKDLLAA